MFLDRELCQTLLHASRIPYSVFSAVNVCQGALIVVPMQFQFLVPRLCPSARLSAPLLAGADGVEENCSHQVELSVSLYNSQFFQNLKATSGVSATYTIVFVVYINRIFNDDIFNWSWS